VLHCFASKDPRYLERMLAAGYYASFAGPLTYKSAPELREMAARVPLDRLLVETDSPYLPPASRRGRRNEPALIRETASCLAAIHNLDLDRLAPSLWRNSLRLFPALAPAAQSPGAAA
jgi:TatD DNase family protein